MMVLLASVMVAPIFLFMDMKWVISRHMGSYKNTWKTYYMEFNFSHCVSFWLGFSFLNVYFLETNANSYMETE